jgi:DNA polymerase-3 subunit alpha
LLVAGDYEGALAVAKQHLEIFGNENYFIEVQNHGIEEQKNILPLLSKSLKNSVWSGSDK